MPSVEQRTANNPIEWRSLPTSGHWDGVICKGMKTSASREGKRFRNNYYFGGVKWGKRARRREQITARLFFIGCWSDRLRLR